MALRSLMNIRMPGAISKEILQVQDAFLKEETMEKGRVNFHDIPTIKEQLGSTASYADKISIWQGDITMLRIGAIVNAANSQMLGCFIPCHRCIDNAIHSAAGIQLRLECNNIMNQKRMQFGRQYEEPTGTAILTKGYNLPSDYVIHTVGPIVRYELTQSLRQDLKNCYLSVLRCAMKYDIRSVAYCCISTGEFHFPNDEATCIAVKTVTDFLEENDKQFERIVFNVYKDIDKKLYEDAFEKEISR